MYIYTHNRYISLILRKTMSYSVNPSVGMEIIRERGTGGVGGHFIGRGLQY